MLTQKQSQSRVLNSGTSVFVPDLPLLKMFCAILHKLPLHPRYAYRRSACCFFRRTRIARDQSGEWGRSSRLRYIPSSFAEEEASFYITRNHIEEEENSLWHGLKSTVKTFCPISHKLKVKGRLEMIKKMEILNSLFRDRIDQEDRDDESPFFGSFRLHTDKRSLFQIKKNLSFVWFFSCFISSLTPWIPTW